ncbi:MAG: molybdenum cofactor biosynthesis protein MoaE [Chloroflexi bacterium]|nr:molybdenum cofactor biosynthesis protein MoaE [Chloroflexota bacterium]
MAKAVELTHQPISAEAMVAKVLKGKHGAVVTFLGIVRNQSEGKAVRYLEYEAYPEVALKKMEELLGEIKARWGIEDVAITHRLGRMEIGETAVIIAVASPHRGEAFEACKYAIDRLKETVPIWKKEVFVDGEHWVAGD